MTSGQPASLTSTVLGTATTGDQSAAPASFTPGPWDVISTIPEDGFEAYWIKAQPNSAMRGFTREIGCVNGPQSGEQEANARLIAAAPDMYEALQKIAGGLANTMSTPGQWMTRIRKDEAYEIARAALAKVQS